MKYCFIKALKKVFNLSFFTGAALLLASTSAIANNPNISLSINDTIAPDTTIKFAVVSVTDSSKLFSSLLSPTVNKTSLFTMNSEAKFFADNFIKTHQAYYTGMKVWGKPYFNLYDKILASYSIPVELKYLSVIESSLSAGAVSWAGAVGPWQIMSGTAQQFGLRTGYYNDDRFDYVKSTNAACKILKSLYDTYGDWLLVIAAYNTGSGNVNRAIAKAHSKNFWDIQYYLPEETRNHVKKFIATHYFFEGTTDINNPSLNNAGNNLLAKDEYLQLAANSTTINIYGKYNSVVIANTLMMDINLFNQLNPDFDKVVAKGDIYPLRIPSDKVDLFQSKKIDMLRQSVELLLSSNTPTPGK